MGEYDDADCGGEYDESGDVDDDGVDIDAECDGTDCCGNSGFDACGICDTGNDDDDGEYEDSDDDDDADDCGYGDNDDPDEYA